MEEMYTSILVPNLLVSIIFAVIGIVALWKVFTKAGEKGWKAIIPVLNGYTLYKISWKPLMYWVTLICGIAASVVYLLNPTSMVLLVIAVALMIIAAVLSIIAEVKLSKAFGHGAGFALGLIFLSPIFMLILAFGSSKYEGNGSQNTDN